MYRFSRILWQSGQMAVAFIICDQSMPSMDVVTVTDDVCEAAKYAEDNLELNLCVCFRNMTKGGYFYVIMADSHYASSRFRSDTVPSPFRQNGLYSHCPPWSVTFQNSSW